MSGSSPRCPVGPSPSKARARVWTLPLGDDIVASVLRDGHYEGGELDGVLAWLGAPTSRMRRPLIVDVGANAGTTAIPLAQRGFRVLAIEPVPRTLEYLLENVRDNGLDGLVTGVQAAISRPGPRVDMVLGGGLGQSEVRLSSDQETLVDSQYRVTASVSVPAAGLSEILDDHAVATNEVAFVWCDTQGSETEVTASGTELWSSGVPLYAELRPAGLTRPRVGLEAFYGVVASNFSAFRPAGLPCRSRVESCRPAHIGVEIPR